MALFMAMGGGNGSGATITLTFSSEFYGQTITATNGTKTVTKVAPSTGTMDITVPESGTWVISSTVSGSTYSTSVEVDLDYTATLEAIPDGSTVLPTDDIQTWLKCAGITDKTTYTTLADVLADTDTFIALCADSNASDYMARSTTWASTVCANATAMQIVGKYDYCANALLSDSTWASAICNSTYASSVVSALVPTMTSNTTPSGECFASSVYGSGYEAYKAFNGNVNDGWNAQNTPSFPEYIGYTSTSKVKVASVLLNVGGTRRVYTFKVQGTDTPNDANSWVDVSDIITTPETNYNKVYPFTFTSSYKSHRILIVTGVTSAGALNIAEIQFYGRVDHGYTGTVIHSAVEDTTYYMEGGQSVPFCTIASGDTETVLASTIESLKNQTITLYSSVAKDPTNLSNDYSKQIRITPNVTEIYLMPYGALYWWGHFDKNCEDCTSANGWGDTRGSATTWQAPTHNKNDLLCNSSADYYFQGVGTKQAIASASKAYMIGQGLRKTNYDNRSIEISIRSVKNVSQNAQLLGSAFIDVNNTGKTEFDVSALSNFVILGIADWGSQGKIFALWYE